jgi:hypothetical protein
VSSPPPPKTIFLRRDILFVRYFQFARWGRQHAVHCTGLVPSMCSRFPFVCCLCAGGTS